jgi:CRISPR-associated protein Csy3
MTLNVASAEIKKNIKTLGFLSNFAISRSMMPTKARMFSVMPDGSMIPVLVNESTQLGSQSQYAAREDFKKATSGNPQRVEEAFLHPDSDTLAVTYGLDILFDQDTANIEICNMAHAEKRVKSFVKAYAAASGFDYLATLYAERIANGYALWRNGKGFYRSVTVKANDGTQNYSFSFVKDKKQNEEAINELAKVIVKGFNGQFITLEVEMRSKLGKGSAVYPSQEFVNSVSKYDPSRVYFKDENNHALIHSQKIGNALRTIDVWHTSFDDVGAIAVEPYGTNSRKSEAYRHQAGSFYTYFREIIYSDDDTNAGMSRVYFVKNFDELDAVEDAHYFAATLLRGGVFGMESNKKDDKKDDKKDGEIENA